MKRISALLCAIALQSCTPGGVPVAGSGGGPVNGPVTKISVSIAAFGQQTTPAGPALGFSPIMPTVSVGSGVQFVNVDNTSHTSTSLPPGTGTTFPPTSPLNFSATTQSGATLSGGWSSGTLQAGQSSQVLLVDRTGTYLYGCFFHYSGTMRGELIAQ